MSKESLVTKEQLIYLMENVSVDHDSTVCDTKGKVTEEFNYDFGTSHRSTEISHRHPLADWAMELGANKSEAVAINDRYWYNEELINRARPNPGAIEFLEKANQIGRLIINSSRPFSQRQGTVDWYARHAPFVKPDQIIVGLPDIVIPGNAASQAVSKAWIINVLGCRSHIEDSTLHAKIILDTTNAFVFLLSDDTSLDWQCQGRLMRFGGINGRTPDLTGLADLLNS